MTILQYKTNNWAGGREVRPSESHPRSQDEGKKTIRNKKIEQAERRHGAFREEREIAKARRANAKVRPAINPPIGSRGGESPRQRVAPLAVDPVGAESQVRRDLVEERVLERLGERDALRRLVIKHALDHVEQHGVVVLVRHLVALERLAIFTNVPPCRALFVPVEPAVVKVLGLRLAAHPVFDTQSRYRYCTMSNSAECVPVRKGPENALHHGQMFAVVVSLEQRHSQVQLEQNAPDGPHVARLRPSELCEKRGIT